MALVLADRVRDTTTTTGTGTVTLSGTAPNGYQTFGAAIGNTNTTYYAIVGGTEWEVGLGTYSSTGPTLARTTVLASSNSNAAVNFSAGTKDVFVTYPASKSIADGFGTLPVANGGSGATTLTGVLKGNGTSAFSASNVSLTAEVTGTLPVANGGTGVTTSTGSGSNVLGTGPTLAGPIINDGYTEEVFAITDGAGFTLDPTNGSIQTITLGANRTPTQANWAAGQSITLMVDDGTARTLTWTTLAVVWKTDGGVAPTLNLTGFTVIVLWKVGTTIYGARVGDA